MKSTVMARRFSSAASLVSITKHKTHWHAAHELALAIPDAKLVVLPGEGHHYLATNPEVAHKAIREFIG
jgi:pimeloyl-ACP methyl ester carboxylesterase